MTTSLENIKNKIDIQEAILKNKLEDNSNALNEKIIHVTRLVETIEDECRNNIVDKISYCNPTTLEALKNCIDKMIEINEQIYRDGQNLKRLQWLYKD